MSHGAGRVLASIGIVGFLEWLLDLRLDGFRDTAAFFLGRVYRMTLMSGAGGSFLR